MLDVMDSAEMASQTSQHTHQAACVHKCLLALTSKLLLKGQPRTQRVGCTVQDPVVCKDRSNANLWRDSEPNPTVVVLTCETCDWDICKDCYDFLNLPPRARDEKRAKLQARANAKRDARLKAEKVLEEQAEAQARGQKAARQTEIHAIQRDVDPRIISPPLKPYLDRANMLTYVVWSSDGYDPDGFYSYDGPPERTFDSTWSTIQAANQRTRYVFYVKNR